MLRKIFIDLDGVLADFNGWKRSLGDLEKGWDWWEEARKVDHFFLHLSLCPNALELMNHLRSFEVPLCIGDPFA